MKSLSFSILRSSESATRQQLKQERNLLVTSGGKPDEGPAESTLLEVQQARAADALTKLQSRSVERGLDRLTMDDIDAEIAEARRARRSK